jgi:gliding motility-associated-like protein
MLKKFLLFFIIFSTYGYSQLSDKHWIPPLHAREASTIEDHYVYLSTAETTPFQVTVTDGSGAIFPGSPFTLSATNPIIINIGSGQNTKMFLGINEVNTIISDKGLILEGDKDFYVSFRMRHASHSETLISKGRPGIGTSFRLGCMINEPNDPRKSFVASVMATEDNTTITLSDYDTNVIFESATGQITADSQTFTLNAGQSVIFTGYSDQGNNLDGIIGALVTSDKPVAVNTGNALGGIDNNRADFTLDQIVSASQIGTEYIFIEGNGLASMELPLIVAHENNTEIFVNGGTTSIATIDAGDYFLVPNSFYQGTINRNIFVRTTKPVFAYQLLGGGSDTATSGLNFIPPLSCFFQNSVNIPNVNEIGGDTYQADLMVLTYSTATLTVNGITIPTTQAQTVLGNSDWVTYRVSNITGNANVNSTGPLAVGVFGYQGNISGYAGYYSGFGSNPEDTAVTVCSNQTINLFDSIIGNPGENGTWTSPLGGAPIVNDIFDPAINIAGVYKYEFTKDCNASLVTIPVNITVTIQQAPFAGNDNSISVCVNDPSFDLFALLGTGALTNGTWSPALASGTGVFNPAVDVSGAYVYTITGDAICPTSSATITVTNNPQPTIVAIPDYKLCDDTVSGTDADGISFFDLTTKDADAIGMQTGIAVTYHLLPNEAVSGTNAITTINSANRTIHVRLRNTTTNCFNVTSFNLVVMPRPTIDNNVTFKQCDVDNDAITTFNLTQANNWISTDATYVFSYHNSLVGAENNTDLVTDEINHIASNGSTVWARITNTEGCIRTSQVNLTVSATTIPSTYRYTIDDECDDYIDANDPDGDGFGYFDLTQIEPALIAQFPAGQSYTFSYYRTQNDAETEQNAITSTTNFRNTTPNNQLIWVRIDSNLYDCAGLGSFLELIVSPLPDVNLGDDFILCVDPVTGVGAKTVNATPLTPGNYSYVWTPANPNGNSPLYTITAQGTFSVVVTNTVTTCVNSDQITSTFSSEPAAFEANLITPAFSTGLATIEAVATGGFGTYEYSLDTIDWQSSPLFSNLQNGSYIVYVRDNQGCGILFSEEIQTITYPSFFTPNNDGFNDYWNIFLPIEYNGLISIFDRYGKLLKQLNTHGQVWDGTFNNNPLPSSDYWFKVEYTENNQRKEFKSHFSLKR